METSSRLLQDQKMKFPCCFLLLLVSPQVVDMRWGVREEMTNEHLTSEICLQELATCQELSIGPNFVYFGGQKYGYRPIPTFIPSEELKLIKVQWIQPVTISLHVIFSECFGKNGWRCGLAGQVVHFRLKQRPSSLNSSANWFSFKKFPEQKESRKPGPRCRCMVGRTRKASRFKISLKTNNEYFVIWGLLRKAAKALFLNDEFTEAQKHNYFMSVTEREVYKGCINAKNVKVSKKSFAAVLTLQSFDRFGDNH